MKKIGLILALLFVLTSNSYANQKLIKELALKDTSNVTISSYSLTSGSAVYSETILVQSNNGFMSMLVTENKAGGAGDVDISAEYSLDGTNWYTAYTTSSGALTAESNIVTTLQNVTRWIVLTPRLSKYVRFKFDPDADSQITVKIFYQYDN